MPNTENGIIEQIFDLVGRAKHVLIALPLSAGGDALGSSLALRDFLSKLEKQVDIVCSSEVPGVFRFLPGAETVRAELPEAASFVISIATNAAPLAELSYEKREAAVEIFLKPKTGKYSREDVTFKTAKFPYDLIVTLDCPSLEHLGALYERNTDLFFETAVINIDHHPSNGNYGQLNLVDLTATATAEILAGLIERYERELMDEAMATALRAGIIAETNSFQSAKTTPRAFLAASALVGAGARQQDIVRELYKTKNVNMLKLWGRALARLREVPELGLAYSLVSVTDLEKSGASAGDILPVMREFAANLAGRRIVMFLAETAPRQVTGYFHLHPSVKSQLVTSALSGHMLNGALGTFERRDTELLSAAEDAIAKITKLKAQIVGE